MYTPTIVYSMNMTRQSRGLLMINREGVLLYTESTSRGQKLAVSGTVSQNILIWTRAHPANEYSIHYGARHRVVELVWLDHF